MRVEGKVLRIQQNVGQGGGVDVGEASQAPEKVSRVVVRPEQTAKVGVEDGLGVFPAHGHRQNKQIITNMSFRWDFKPRSILATHAFDLVGIKKILALHQRLFRNSWC